MNEENVYSPVRSDLEVEDTDVPPVKEIRELLSNFELRIPVWGLTVFTVDGYIIAHKLFYDAMPNEIGLAISSMSAGLITISEDFIRMVDSRNIFRQVLVDSEDTDGSLSFSILLKNITENVLIACIFPSSTQLGLVTFEVQNLSNDILDVVNRWDVKLHDDTVT
ncbi:MAG: roadblock/LC7 domain-containing protein [Candidatus Thorarchaeota archaeon]